MTKICVTLTQETTAGIVDRMADLAHLADLFEIRGDLVLDLDLLAILRSKTRPLVFSCRRRRDGGRWEDTEPRRRFVLLEAVKRGFDYVDVEHQSEFLDVMMEKSGKGLIVSFHDLEATPADLDGLYRAMCRKGADFVKIAVTPRSFGDVARLIGLASRINSETGPRLIPIALGPTGLLTRILAGRWGAPLTYACTAEGAEAGPGQIPVGHMVDLYRARTVTPATRLYGILGSDVTRSLSPILHNRAFEARKIDGVYVPLQTDALEPFVEALPRLGLSGFSVTRPYKVAIVAHIQRLEEAAALCQSVNTVVVRDGALEGSTTDGSGLLAPLKREIDVKGRAVVILGAGGAARAAALALQRRGARVLVLARDPAKAALVATTLGCAHGDLSTLKDREWDILINATPLGSSAAPEATPVPASLHRAGSVVLDMVYDPVETRLLREAKAAGCVIIDGLEMLLAQAALQFEAWTGLEAPYEAMKSAAFPAQDRSS
jgi:3-dehydroquinate dehydratase/shikimate dehydrogenase